MVTNQKILDLDLAVTKASIGHDFIVNEAHLIIDLGLYLILSKVCIFTSLGGSSALSGQEITLEVMERKPAMIASLSPKTAEDAPNYDDGSIPGDGLGAAGLDSSIFAHLKVILASDCSTRDLNTGLWLVNIGHVT